MAVSLITLKGLLPELFTGCPPTLASFRQHLEVDAREDGLNGGKNIAPATVIKTRRKYIL